LGNEKQGQLRKLLQELHNWDLIAKPQWKLLLLGEFIGKRLGQERLALLGRTRNNYQFPGPESIYSSV